jgi:putative addiction module component (TIGR02574 family)
MSSKTAELLAAALKLPPEERQELADRLLDSLDPPASAIDRMTDAEFEAELTRRMDESDRDPSVRIPWEQVREMR